MHDLCIFFVQKSFLTKTFLLFAEINFTRGPLYTCLVLTKKFFCPKSLLDSQNCLDGFQLPGVHFILLLISYWTHKVEVLDNEVCLSVTA